MTKRVSFRVFLSVLHALFLRELSMRFSSGRMGMFWTFFEPFFQILVFVIIKIVIFGSRENNFDFAVFLAINFTAFNLFKNIVIKSIASFKANKALFLYKQVKPIDTIIARSMVEVFISSIIILIFFSIGFFFNYDIAVKDLTMVTFGFIYLIFFAFSFGLFLAVVNVFIDSVSKLINFFMTALMFSSAVFYTMDILPSNLRDVLFFNPVAHFMEIIHGFYFHSLDDSFVSYDYITVWTLSLLYFGLWLYSKLEKRIISS
ncbi:MAG: ABC transporter permease [Epsilonproteobacteria bacterium]|nr:ABC transporter permease [Campylobacterota bacterium]